LGPDDFHALSYCFILQFNSCIVHSLAFGTESSITEYGSGECWENSVVLFPVSRLHVAIESVSDINVKGEGSYDALHYKSI
jgi:hypothetical protein